MHRLNYNYKIAASVGVIFGRTNQTPLDSSVYDILPEPLALINHCRNDTEYYSCSIFTYHKCAD